MAKRARVRTSRGAKKGKQAIAERKDFNYGLEPVAKRPAVPNDQLPHNDELEGMIRDPVLYQGQAVSLVADIGVHDSEYDPNVRQVKIQRLGQKPEIVPAADINTVTVQRPVLETRAPRRIPSQTFPKGHPAAFPGEGRT